MLICVNVVQLCDATDDDSSTAAGYIIKLKIKLSPVHIPPYTKSYN